MRLKTEFEFEAAHKLEGYNGKCANLHGHRWKVVIFVEGKDELIDENGILWDFNNAYEIKEELEHKYLNEILSVSPSAENIALWILKKLKDNNKNLLFKVRVYENAKSYAEVGDIEKQKA
ncbi:MAG: 6-carboxytetrahydropterin synthase [Candidatus Pacearchaeota archaeon]|nr:6-carboxytetrahydropterin synthase [Candidatus Pacearchaeota archaeon]